MLLQQLINGITLGGIYALIALGYTMVYGILLMINFAHSEIFMIGAYLGLLAIVILIPTGMNPICIIGISMLFSIVITGMLGVAIERIAYRPLRHSPRLAPLISAIGVSIFLQNLIMITVSSQSISYPEIFPIKAYTIFAGGMNSASISSIQLFIILSSIILMIILHLFVKNTKMGKAMRACSQDRQAAGLMGISVNKIISITFFIGAGLGGVAGVLNGLYYGSIKYNMGFILGIKAFTAAVLGGIGNIKGAMVGGLILGVLESLGVGYISSEYKDVIAFSILILVLIFKPGGIFGEQVSEKV
ncbi:MAG: branched-chain amino acid ABC transporter permease [Candidatus Desantisbacteria bacterium]